MKSIIQRIRAYRRRKLLVNIRRDFAFFGLPLNDFSDDELEQGIIRGARVIAQCGISAASSDIAARLQSIGLLKGTTE